MRIVLLSVVGLVIVGLVAWWLIKLLLGVVLYLLVGALVIGGGVYLYHRAKNALTGSGQRWINR